MRDQVDTRNPMAVRAVASEVYASMFPGADGTFVASAFAQAIECFEGRYRDYQAIDARYHDLEHTMQGTLCMMRLLSGRHAAGAEPHVDRRTFELGLLAILLHDTGYLKRGNDRDGTGAKYTLTHVVRSAEFAADLLKPQGYTPGEIQTVQNMIRCTGVNIDLKSIPFQSDLERLVGFALGTADLLGQMAAADYIDKLPILFEEFAESARYNQGRMASAGTFASAEDLMRKTPLFWQHYVLPKVHNDFLGLYQFLKTPYPDGPNPYVDRILANLDRLNERLAAGV